MNIETDRDLVAWILYLVMATIIIRAWWPRNRGR